MRGAFRDRHDSRGGMRWTRQRRAGTKVAGRKPGGRARALYKGCAQGPEAREGLSLRQTTLRGAAGAEICPTDTALARRPKSCGPAKSGLLFARLQPQARSTAETTASGFDRCRGEHEASRKPTARGTPDVSGAAVVTNSCAFYTLRMRLRTHGASGVPRALFSRGRSVPRKTRAHRAARSRSCIHPTLRALFDR